MPPLFLPQILHGMAWYFTWAFEVRDRLKNITLDFSQTQQNLFRKTSTRVNLREHHQATTKIYIP